jgi:predicted secreted protein
MVTTTSLDNLNQSSTSILSVYPNPTTDQLSVILNNEKEGAWKISVHDISGRLVKSFDSYISSATRNVSVYTGDLESGNYLLHFQSEGQILRTKFVVSK